MVIVGWGEVGLEDGIGEINCDGEQTLSSHSPGFCSSKDSGGVPLNSTHLGLPCSGNVKGSLSKYPAPYNVKVNSPVV